MDACNEKRSHLQKSDGVKTQKELEDTEGFDWLDSTELAINKRKNLLSRLIRKAGPFHKIKTSPIMNVLRIFFLDLRIVVFPFPCQQPDFKCVLLMTSQSLQLFVYLGCYMKFIIQNKLVSLI